VSVRKAEPKSRRPRKWKVVCGGWHWEGDYEASAEPGIVAAASLLALRGWLGPGDRITLRTSRTKTKPKLGKKFKLTSPAGEVIEIDAMTAIQTAERLEKGVIAREKKKELKRRIAGKNAKCDLLI
jgi:hypothetical protein